MDLRRLEYFLAVVQHGQVTSAASALRVAQPSLSQAIKALERDLGVQLFTREGRTLLADPGPGPASVEPSSLIGDLDTAAAVAGTVVEPAAGRLDIAAHGSRSWPRAAVAALAAFHERYAGIPVRVHSPRDEDELEAACSPTAGARRAGLPARARCGPGRTAAGGPGHLGGAAAERGRTGGPAGADSAWRAARHRVRGQHARVRLITERDHGGTAGGEGAGPAGGTYPAPRIDPADGGGRGWRLVHYQRVRTGTRPGSAPSPGGWSHR